MKLNKQASKQKQPSSIEAGCLLLSQDIPFNTSSYVRINDY